MAKFYNPVQVDYLSLNQFIDTIENYPFKISLGLFLNRSLVKKLELNLVVERLTNIFSESIWVNDIKPNPTIKDIKYALECLGQNKVDLIIAMGGGSVIDLAKSVKALEKYRTAQPILDEDIVKIIENKKYLNKPSNIPVLAIPTTAGTGSEMTKWCTIWDPLNNKKYSIEADWLYPSTAFLIPELTYSLPLPITISTSLDAFAQACEAFWAKASNPYIKEFALTAISIIKNNLPIIKKDPNDHHARSKLLIASSISGLAFSQTRTTACHSISYPLTSRFNIPHGIAVILSLSEIIKINIKKIPEIDEIIKLFNSIDGLNDWLSEVTKPYYDLSLSSYGVQTNDIPLIINESFTKGRMDNNPVTISKNDLLNLLHKIF